MRRIWTILAGVALVVGVSAPAWSADRGDDRDGNRSGSHEHRGDREAHHRDGRYGDGGYYGYDGRCGYYGCGGPYYGPYYGGYGCNYDYPCDASYDHQSSDCFKYSHSGHATRDPNCQYDPSCDCWYRSSESPPKQGAGPGSSGSTPPSGGNTGGGGGH
jgi:hypothetical protein